MSDTSNEDKTEQPTRRRLERAREEGTVARAQGLPGAAIMVTAALFFILAGRSLVMSALTPGDARAAGEAVFNAFLGDLRTELWIVAGAGAPDAGQVRRGAAVMPPVL